MTDNRQKEQQVKVKNKKDPIVQDLFYLDENMDAVFCVIYQIENSMQLFKEKRFL